MDKHEAVHLIQRWIHAHSPFSAEVVTATARADGVWEVTVEYSELSWRQTISPVGEVGPPVWVN
jgi:hypothetical protein